MKEKTMTDKQTAIEAWKPIPGYEGIYEASSFGSIRSIDRIIKYKNGQQNRPHKGKIFKATPDKDGYRKVHLSVNGTQKRWSVHRLVILTFHGDSELHVDHINNHREDNRIENLQYVTNRENILRGKLFKDRYMYYCKRDRRWNVKIRINNKYTHLGSTKYESVARKIRDDFLKNNPEFNIRPCVVM